jgi:T5orf172 domain-containing protein
VKCSRCQSVLLNRVTVCGYVYVLSNPKMKGLFKIGYSERAVKERIEELNSATGVPAPFELEAAFASSEPKAHEQKVHAELQEYRIPGKEFFEVHISKALAVIESICKRPPVFLNDRSRSAWKSLDHTPSGEPYDSNYEYMRRRGF